MSYKYKYHQEAWLVVIITINLQWTTNNNKLRTYTGHVQCSRGVDAWSWLELELFVGTEILNSPPLIMTRIPIKYTQAICLLSHLLHYSQTVLQDNIIRNASHDCIHVRLQPWPQRNSQRKPIHAEAMARTCSRMDIIILIK